MDIPSARTGRSQEFPTSYGELERLENASGGTASLQAPGKSDGLIVPAKRANKTGTPAAEPVEERGSPNGNAIRNLLLPDSVPAFCVRLQCESLRQVEMVNILTVIPKGGAV